MNCQLHDHFEQLAKTLPIEEKQKCMFTSQSFSDFPDRLKTDQVVVRKKYVDHDGFRVDRLEFLARGLTYRELGLLILSVVFRVGGSRVHLELTEPTTDIRNLIIQYSGKTRRSFAYRTRPEEFLFLPGKVDTHPWMHQPIELSGLPIFKLTSLNEFVVTERDWAQRDTVTGFGTDDASVRLAELLLRFGSSGNETHEIVLEGEGGFRGVGVHSSEAAFYLLGSVASPPPCR